jgi:hypothetical protein
MALPHRPRLPACAATTPAAAASPRLTSPSRPTSGTTYYQVKSLYLAALLALASCAAELPTLTTPQQLFAQATDTPSVVAPLLTGGKFTLYPIGSIEMLFTCLLWRPQPS